VVAPVPVRPAPAPRPIVVPPPAPTEADAEGMGAADADADAEAGGEGEAEVLEPVPVVRPKGTVVVKGSADRVLLVSDDESLGPGEVPAGLYTVYAAFMPDASPVKVNVIEVRPGQRVTVTCNKLTYTCE
jgi:hypothetical protein